MVRVSALLGIHVNGPLVVRGCGYGYTYAMLVLGQGKETDDTSPNFWVGLAPESGGN